MSKTVGGNSAKIGRHNRAKSNAQQAYRTEKNKRKRSEKAAALAATPKKMRVPRGTARRKARGAMGLTSPAKTQSKTDLAKKYPDFYQASVDAGVLPGFSVLGELVSGKTKG